jgi:hypothetical protein
MGMEYNKNWYQKNKQTHMEKLLAKEICPTCKTEFSHTNKLRHYRTKKHKANFYDKFQIEIEK